MWWVRSYWGTEWISLTHANTTFFSFPLSHTCTHIQLSTRLWLTVCIWIWTLFTHSHTLDNIIQRDNIKWQKNQLPCITIQLFYIFLKFYVNTSQFNHHIKLFLKMNLGFYLKTVGSLWATTIKSLYWLQVCYPKKIKHFPKMLINLGLQTFQDIHCVINNRGNRNYTVQHRIIWFIRFRVGFKYVVPCTTPSCCL